MRLHGVTDQMIEKLAQIQESEEYDIESEAMFIYDEISKILKEKFEEVFQADPQRGRDIVNTFIETYLGNSDFARDFYMQY